MVLQRKKTVKELNELGPIFEDMDLEIHTTKKTVGGEIAESYYESTYPGGFVHLSFSDHDAFIEKSDEELAAENFNKEELASFVKSFRNSYESAVNYRDFSYVENYLLIGSPAYKELADYVSDLKDENYSYNFTSDIITDIKMTPEKGVVSTDEKFTFTNHKGDVTHYDRSKEYTIINSEGSYKIIVIEILDTKRKRGGN